LRATGAGARECFANADRELNILAIHGSIQFMTEVRNMKRVILQSAILTVLTLIIVFAPNGTRAVAGARQGQQGQTAPPPAQQQPQGNYQISVSAGLVNVDAVVTDNDGGFLQGLKKENFRILEDGKPQIITNFTSAGDAPITIVMLIEFRANMNTGNYSAWIAKTMAPAFLNNIKKNDWIALEDFDLNMRVDVDFTHDPFEVMRELQRMQVPLYSEANLFDAVIETLDRLQDVKGKKSILILASGFDTFSKHHYDECLKRVRQSDVTIYAIGLSQIVLNDFQMIGGINSQVAQNQLRSISELTGGQSWTPDMMAQAPDYMKIIAASLRNQYTLGYAPPEQDGKYHKIKVELVNADGSPYVQTNQKGKKLKLLVYAREGYTAAKAPVGD
jgi:VWFA-related protein